MMVLERAPTCTNAEKRTTWPSAAERSTLSGRPSADMETARRTWPLRARSSQAPPPRTHAQPAGGFPPAERDNWPCVISAFTRIIKQ